MEIGEKYLTIKLVGHDYVAAFPNKEKKDDKEPDFKGNGVAVWISEKGAKKKESEEAEKLLAGDAKSE